MKQAELRHGCGRGGACHARRLVLARRSALGLSLAFATATVAACVDLKSSSDDSTSVRPTSPQGDPGTPGSSGPGASNGGNGSTSSGMPDGTPGSSTSTSSTSSTSSSSSSGMADDGGARVAVDRRFAQWATPPTARPLSQFVIGADTVQDTFTNLEWMRNDEVSPARTLAETKNYCDNLDFAGHDDWRLPTRIEMLSLADFTVHGAWVSDTLFPVSFPHTHINWTASKFLLSGRLDQYFVVTLGDRTTNLYSDAPTNTMRPRCVRGGATTQPRDRWVMKSADVARDVVTGLDWQVTPLGGAMNWTSAGQSCTLAGWRLPTPLELLSITDETKDVAPLLVAPLKPAPGGQARYWTATVDSTSIARWVVDFAKGSFDRAAEDIDLWPVRCVK